MTELAVVEDPTAFNIDRTVQGPDRFRIGSTRHGYIYTKMPGGYVWKCERAAAGEDAGMPGQVLFIFKTQRHVFEAHHGDEHMMSSQEVEEAYMAYQTNLVFGCDEEMLTAGTHVWDSFDNKKTSLEEPYRLQVRHRCPSTRPALLSRLRRRWSACPDRRPVRAQKPPRLGL